MRTITSQRLILRPWDADDAGFLLDLEGRWEVVRYLGAEPTTMTSHNDAVASIARRRATSEHPIHGIWIITDRTGARLGNLLLKPIPLSAGEEPSDPAEVEIGWHLHTLTPGGADTRPRPPPPYPPTPSPAVKAESSP